MFDETNLETILEWIVDAETFELEELSREIDEELNRRGEEG